MNCCQKTVTHMVVYQKCNVCNKLYFNKEKFDAIKTLPVRVPRGRAELR